jgi:hypothetical protein
VLMVEGRWRVETSGVTVQCTIARGAQRRYAVMSLHGTRNGRDTSGNI